MLAAHAVAHTWYSENKNGARFGVAWSMQVDLMPLKEASRKSLWENSIWISLHLEKSSQYDWSWILSKNLCDPFDSRMFLHRMPICILSHSKNVCCIFSVPLRELNFLFDLNCSAKRTKTLGITIHCNASLSSSMFDLSRLANEKKIYIHTRMLPYIHIWGRACPLTGRSYLILISNTVWAFKKSKTWI